MSDARERVIVALDLPSDEAIALVDELGEACAWYKVGLTTFVEAGPPAVRALVDRGKKVFLDLKLHDIPFQVAGAVERACDLGVDLLTVHGLGGARMLEAAVRAAAGSRTRVVAVTVLTSMDDADIAGIGLAGGAVERLAAVAAEAGAFGVVASGAELPVLRASFPTLATVVPGIRPTGHIRADDQRRVVTAGAAISMGADYIVVGRPVTQAGDPLAALRAILEEVEQASSLRG